MSDHGKFCWYELMAPDVDAAAAFYTNVFGWSAEDSGTPGVDYRLLKQGVHGVGGLMATFEGGPSPSWTGYVNVDDADAAIARAKEGGAIVHREPTDIPGIGRFAIFTDPQGAPIAIIQVVPPPPGSPINVSAGWHELHSTDWEAGFGFHSGLFGWEKSTAMDMGPAGTYQIMARGGEDFGAMFNSGEGRSYWLFYFRVPELETVLDKVKAGGGSIAHGPIEVPTGDWVATCVDPQGAIFSVVAALR